MTVAFDLSTPKQITFFRPMIELLREQGEQVMLVTRDYAELDLLLKQHGLRAKSFGSFGGKTRLGKLKRSAERVQLLADYFHRKSPDVLVTLSNVDSIRTAYGLGIPIVCFNDLPESRPVGRLTLPLATKVCAPWVVPKKAFAEYGVGADRLYQYRSLDQLSWLDGHRVDASYPKKLGFDAHRPLLVFRETEVQASYVQTDIVGEVFRRLRRKHPKWQLLNIPRYRLHRPYDTGSLLSQADVFVGGGGTMCIEAAYYGTPVVATRELQCHYMAWLCRQRLAEEHLAANEAVIAIERIVQNRRTEENTRRRDRASRVFSKIPFPLEETVDVIMTCARGSGKS